MKFSGQEIVFVCQRDGLWGQNSLFRPLTGRDIRDRFADPLWRQVLSSRILSEGQIAPRAGGQV